MTGYKPKTAPYEHQREALRRSLMQPFFALFMEQRTGKTKVIIDTAAYHFELGQRAAGCPHFPPSVRAAVPASPPPAAIDALFVIAMPSGAPMQWVLDEIPTHLPDRIPRQCLVWRASKAATKRFRAEADALLNFKGLAVLAVNGEAIITTAFREYALKFLRARRCLVAIDETTLVCKTHNTARTKVLKAIKKQPGCVMRRILDGTPYGESPLDLYAQTDWLDGSILEQPSFYTFKQHYAVLEKQTATRFDPKKQKYVTYEYDSVEGYRNLDELYERLAPHSFRVRRADVSDAPPKTYQKLRFDLSAEQRRVYDDLRDRYETELRGEKVAVQHVLTRYMRLQQVASNCLPGAQELVKCAPCAGAGCEECDYLGVTVVDLPMRRISKNNPRLDALAEHAQINNEQVIVWARFTQDIDDIMALGKELKRNPVRYDGKTSQDEKHAAKAAFQAGAAGWLVGHPKAGGRALRLDAARAHYFYSNTHSLLMREQAEDRAETIDRKTSTGIIDLIANDTVDEEIVETLREKRHLSEVVMQENRGKWI